MLFGATASQGSFLGCCTNMEKELKFKVEILIPTTQIRKVGLIQIFGLKNLLK